MIKSSVWGTDWYKVYLDMPKYMSNSSKISHIHWCFEHESQKRFAVSAGFIAFEDEKDAMWFALKWR